MRAERETGTLLVVHPHYHPRRTGVTTHTESVLRALAGGLEARCLGAQLTRQLPRTTLGEVWARAGREPVIWHAHRNHELLLGLLLRTLGRQVRVVFTRHGGHRPGWWTRLLARYADARIALDGASAGLLGHPVWVVSHGVDLERFRPALDRAKAFAALGLPGRHAVGVVGRVRPAKGQADFAEAVAPLLEAHPEWTPVLVGLVKRGDRPWAQGLVARTGGRLRLAGEQADVTPWYHGLSVVVQPSHSESFGLVLLEAMATGACLVATRLPHVPAIVTEGVTGFLYEPGDVEGLRGILARLFTEPGLAARVGEAAAQECRRRFGVEREASQLADIYRQAARQGAAP